MSLFSRAMGARIWLYLFKIFVLKYYILRLNCFILSQPFKAFKIRNINGKSSKCQIYSRVSWKGRRSTYWTLVINGVGVYRGFSGVIVNLCFKVLDVFEDSFLKKDPNVPFRPVLCLCI